MGMRPHDYFKLIDLAELERLASDLMDAGFSESEIRDDLPQILDALTPWPVILPGLAGLTLEAFDDRIYAALVNALWPLIVRRAGRRRQQITAKIPKQ